MCYLDDPIYKNERAAIRNLMTLRHLVNEPQGVNGHRLTSINIQFKETGLLIILKKTAKTVPMVGFIEAANLDDALYVMANEIKSKRVRWRKDEWRMRDLDKKRDSA